MGMQARSEEAMGAYGAHTAPLPPPGLTSESMVLRGGKSTPIRRLWAGMNGRRVGAGGVGGAGWSGVHAIRDESEKALPGITARHLHDQTPHASLDPGGDFEQF